MIDDPMFVRQMRQYEAMDPDGRGMFDAIVSATAARFGSNEMTKQLEAMKFRNSMDLGRQRLNLMEKGHKQAISLGNRSLDRGQTRLDMAKSQRRTGTGLGIGNLAISGPRGWEDKEDKETLADRIGSLTETLKRKYGG